MTFPQEGTGSGNPSASPSPHLSMTLFRLVGNGNAYPKHGVLIDFDFLVRLENFAPFDKPLYCENLFLVFAMMNGGMQNLFLGNEQAETG